MSKNVAVPGTDGRSNTHLRRLGELTDVNGTMPNLMQYKENPGSPGLEVRAQLETTCPTHDSRFYAIQIR